MLMIVAHHYSVHGEFTMLNKISFNNMWINFLSLWGKLGVNIFIMISGYFLINSKFKVQKLIKLVLEVFLYSTGILILFWIFKLETIGIKVIIKSIFPIIFSQYWFITSYIIMYILSPFLNKFLKNLSKMEYIRLLIVLTVLLSIVPTFTTNYLGFGNVFWFIFIYFISGYISIFYNDTIKPKQCLLIFVVSFTIIFLSAILLNILGKYNEVFFYNATYFGQMNSIFILICTIFLFLYFKNIDIQYFIINKVSVTTLGIYLIHDNSLVRKILWTKITKNNLFYNSDFLILHSVISIVLVFITSMGIEYLRNKFFNKILLKISELILGFIMKTNFLIRNYLIKILE